MRGTRKNKKQNENRIVHTYREQDKNRGETIFAVRLAAAAATLKRSSCSPSHRYGDISRRRRRRTSHHRNNGARNLQGAIIHRHSSSKCPPPPWISLLRAAEARGTNAAAEQEAAEGVNPGIGSERSGGRGDGGLIVGLFARIQSGKQGHSLGGRQDDCSQREETGYLLGALRVLGWTCGGWRGGAALFLLSLPACACGVGYRRRRAARGEAV